MWLWDSFFKIKLEIGINLTYTYEESLQNIIANLFSFLFLDNSITVITLHISSPNTTVLGKEICNVFSLVLGRIYLTIFMLPHEK